MRTAARALGTLISIAQRPVPIVPSQPSCSRWLTCSCCRPAKYFSPNSRQAPTRPEPQQALAPAEAPTPNPKSEAHFLPLPPRLPYSPTSHPFKRHLEILSLSAISSTPDESWRIYLSLHPSLRRYIPDNIFRSFLAHQLSHKQPVPRWVRSQTLIQFAQKCGLTLDSLGPDVVHHALQAGLEFTVEVKKETAGMEAMLGALWGTLKRMWKGDMSRLDLETRRRWLEFYLLGVDEWQTLRKARPNSPYTFRRPAQVVREAVECGASAEVDESLNLLLRAGAAVGDEEAEAVKVVLLCWRKGIGISDFTIGQALQRLEEAAGGTEGLVRKACIGVPEHMADRIEAVLASALQRSLPPIERARSLLAQASEHVGSLIRVGLQILDGECTTADLDTVIDISERLQSTRDSEAESLYHALAKKLEEGARLGSVPEATLLRASRNLAVACTHCTDLTNLLLSLTYSDSAEIYAAARSIYPTVRAAGAKWTWRTASQGRILFQRAIDSERRQLHFASRLYADLIADGHPPSRQDMLDMIQSIGMSQNASRPILLERHLRDFIEFYPGRQGPLVWALVPGLVRNGYANDALLAWTLVKRLGQQSGHIPARWIVECLSQSPRFVHRQAMLEILAAQSTEPDTLPELYDIVLSSFILRSSSKTHRAFPVEAALAEASAVFRDMSRMGIPPSAKAITALLRGLVEANQFDTASEFLKAAVQAGIKVKSSAIGRFMVGLAMAERYDEAEEVERVWRASLGAQDRLYDRGVVGARAMMDIKRGREVDLEDIRERTGWVGTRPFLQFLRGLKVGAEAEEEEKEAVVQADPVMAEAESKGSAAEGFRGKANQSGARGVSPDHEVGFAGLRYRAFGGSTVTCIAV